MSKWFCFKTPFHNHHVYVSRPLLKSARWHFFPIVSWSWEILCWKRSLILKYEILRLFVNTMTADDNCSSYKTETFLQTIEIQLSKKPKTFFGFFIIFLNFISIFRYFEKRDKLQSLSVSQVIDPEKRFFLNF